MKIQEEAPRLNPWPFLVGDAALLATAYLIGSQSRAPLTGAPLICVVLCVGLGAVLAIIPFLLNHTRRQEIALAERQREIAALAQTTATSAEQISIAAASLHTLSENAARAAKIAEHIPQKIQDKINEFKTQLNEVAVTENETLAQEINTLRASETERLETVLAGVRKTAADLAMVEALGRKHIAELNETLALFASSAGKAANDAARTIDAARAHAETAIANALVQLDRRILALADRTAAPAETAPRPPSAPPFPSHAQEAPSPAAPAAPPANAASAPPVPAPAQLPAETTPSAQTGATAPLAAPPVLLAEEKPARKRPPRKTTAATDSELMLGLAAPDDDFTQVSPEDHVPAVSADGLTRLLVTAYIGIGNKLHARGDGPGLSWDRGVPLQFVSIGKWRWETPDATAPVTIKLYKNDEIEPVSPGALTLRPGHQHEVTASFG